MGWEGEMMADHKEREIRVVVWKCSDCPMFKPNFIQMFLRHGLRGYCSKVNIEIFNASADIPPGCNLPLYDWSKKTMTTTNRKHPESPCR